MIKLPTKQKDDRSRNLFIIKIYHTLYSISRYECALVHFSLREPLVVVQGLLRDLPDALVGVEGDVRGHDDVVHGGKGSQIGQVHEAAAAHILKNKVGHH